MFVYRSAAKLCVGYALIALSGAAWAIESPAFQGQWAYKQACGQHHVAEVKLVQSGSAVSGEWSDGNQASGADGRLKGSIRDGKLFVRYCGSDEQAGYALCPKYEAEETDYFARQGRDLVWYQMTGKTGDHTFRKYVVLHPVSDGKPVVADTKCDDGA